MRGPPPQSDCWSATNEGIYQSPKHFNERHQSQHPQSHNNIRSADYNHLSPNTQNAASEIPMFGGGWPLHNLASDVMTVPTCSTSTSTASPTHFQYVDYEQSIQSLLDNEANLEKMRHERELVFEKAPTELEQAKCDNVSSVPSNKAWEDAWTTLREQMTKM
ncbi:hypothetical protein KCU78_g8464, partial [Aureobasidium melanogenum]